MQSIVRFNDSTTQNVVFTNSTSTTGGFAMAVHSGAMLLVSATSSGAAITLTFRTKMTAGSSDIFTACNASNSPVTLTVQPGRAYAVPDELFAASYVTATTANAGETVTCLVATKS
jgi:hypothetical protein